jgi:hypothetical protein
MNRFYLLISVLALSFTVAIAQDDNRIKSQTPDLYYSFETQSFSAPAAGAIPLEFYKRGADYNIGEPVGDDFCSSIPGPTPTKGALLITDELNIKVVNPQPSEAGLTTYTLLFDFMIPHFMGEWRTLFQPDMTNTADAMLYHDGTSSKTGSIGKRSYSDKDATLPGVWYRFVATIRETDNAGLEYIFYINGEEVLNNPSCGVEEMTIRDYFWIFTENLSIYDFDFRCSGFAFWTRALTAEEVAALGAIETQQWGSSPFPGANLEIPGTIEAEHFNDGENGIAYYVNDASKGGSNNSSRQDVLLPIRDEGEGDFITLSNRDYADYTVNIAANDVVFIMPSLSGTAEGTLYFYLDGEELAHHAVEPSEIWYYPEIRADVVEGQHNFEIFYRGSGDLKINDIYFSGNSFSERKTITELEPDLYYSFENPADYAAPQIGSQPLVFYTRGEDQTIGAPGGVPTAASGPTADKKAILVPPELNIQTPNPAGAGLDTYTLLIDLRIPTDDNNWRGIFQPVIDNNIDCFLYHDNSDGSIGKRDYPNSGAIMPLRWYRVVLVADNTNPANFKYQLYVNGELSNNMMRVSASEVTLGAYFWLFTDDLAEYDFDFETSGIAFWSKALSDEDIKALSDARNATSVRQLLQNESKIYAKDGKLIMTNISPFATINIINLAGQRIVSDKSASAQINLPTKGIYIVTATEKGKTTAYKVINK